MADSYSHPASAHACMPRIAAPSWLSIGTPAFAVIAFLRRWRERAQQINPKQQQPRKHPSTINPIAPPTIGAARRLIICRHIVASSQRWLPTFAATQLVAEHCAGAPPDPDGAALANASPLYRHCAPARPPAVKYDDDGPS